MRPKQQKKASHDDLFKARLDQIINMKHELVALADKIDWAWLDEKIVPYFSDEGRPGEPVRFMWRPWRANGPSARPKACSF